MTGWALVQWTQAHQIGTIMGLKGPKSPPPGVTPDQHFHALVDADRPADAVAFLAHALPRYELIVWACRFIGDITPDSTRTPEDLRAIEVARRWVRDPVDGVRRQAWAMSETMEENSPEKLLLNAIFMSGGSIAPEDLPPVHPPEQTAAHLAGAAIALAAYNMPSPVSALAKALEMGEQLATRAG